MNAHPNWPSVDRHDDGIRAYGPPDKCFYCRRKVGAAHGPECVIVTKRIELSVRAKLPSGVYVGTWQLTEPHAWDSQSSEFHKNESSWCSGNFLEERASVVWDGAEPWEELDALHDGGDCLCNRLSFTFLRVVDDTPTRKLRRPEPVSDQKETP